MTELEEKTERLVRMLAENGFDAVIFNSQHNFAWLTGGGCNGVDLSRENGVASLMVTRDGGRFVFANNIEMQRMLAEQLDAADFDAIEFSWQEEKADSGVVLKTAKQIIGGGSKFATDIAMFADALPIDGKIAACRYSLTTDERERFRKLGKDAGEAMSRAIRTLKQGDTEIAAAEKLRHQLATDGIASVVTLVAADERISRFRHPVPTENRWVKTLLLVTCAKRHGLIASLSRMVSIGEPSDELKRKTDAAAYVDAALLDATRPGTTGAELYRIAADAYSAKGFADDINKHHQGGAAGYKTRDWVAHPASGEIVQDGQAFAWNPSITGTKVEETCIVVDGKIEVITATPDVPVITAAIGSREYHSPGIISL